MLLSDPRVNVSACGRVDERGLESDRRATAAGRFVRGAVRQGVDLERVRAAEPLGFDDGLWKALRDTGVVEMAVEEAAGGWGASVLELALTAEPFGRALASAPVIEAQVAARLLARCGQPGADWLSRVLAGDALIAFTPRSGRGTRLGLVAAGAVADAIVALVDDRLLAGGAGGAIARRWRILRQCRWRTSTSATMPLSLPMAHGPADSSRMPRPVARR